MLILKDYLYLLIIWKMKVNPLVLKEQEHLGILSIFLQSKWDKYKRLKLREIFTTR